MTEKKIKKAAEAKKPDAAKRLSEPKKAGMSLWVGAGIGAGIGSAAIAAALLYANHSKRQEPKPKGPKDDGEA